MVLLALGTLGGCKDSKTSSGTSAVKTSGCKQDYLALSGRVVDAANLLPLESETRLVTKLAELERKTGHQLVVATTPSLQGKPIETYSLCLANHWGVGRKGVNDGVVLLVAPNDRKIRIEVGYGLEAELTDTEAGRIINQAILPAFQSRAFDKGVEAGTDQILQEIG